MTFQKLIDEYGRTGNVETNGTSYIKENDYFC